MHESTRKGNTAHQHVLPQTHPARPAELAAQVIDTQIDCRRDVVDGDLLAQMTEDEVIQSGQRMPWQRTAHGPLNALPTSGR